VSSNLGSKAKKKAVWLFFFKEREEETHFIKHHANIFFTDEQSSRSWLDYFKCRCTMW